MIALLAMGAVGVLVGVLVPVTRRPDAITLRAVGVAVLLIALLDPFTLQYGMQAAVNFGAAVALVSLVITVIRPRFMKARPKCFRVPLNNGAILDLSPNATTPERLLKDELLSRTGPDVIVIEGMGGVGKLTIARELGHDQEVWAKFRDGVWFIQLGEEATIDKFWTEMLSLVDKLCRPFSARFEKLLARSADPEIIVLELAVAIGSKRFLIIMSDLWVHSSVGRIVLSLASQLSRQIGSTKILISTREAAVADTLSASVVVKVDPRSPKGYIAKAIICHYAHIAVSSMDAVPANIREAFEKVLTACDGLPLALCVAGNAVKTIMSDDDSEGGAKLNAWVYYATSLNENVNYLGEKRGNIDHVSGVYDAIDLSLRMLNSMWPVAPGLSEGRNVLSANEVLRSHSIIVKKDCVPLEALQLMWGVDASQAKVILRIFSESNLVTRVLQGDSLGVKVHDLVLDYATLLAREQGEDKSWHKRLVEGYAANLPSVRSSSGDLPYLRPWWCMTVSSDKYLVDNLVRHMLRCGLENEAIALLCDYRWIEFVNNDLERLPFQRQIADLELLQAHLSNVSEWIPTNSADSLETLRIGVELITEGMQFCMSHCVRNREECSFQLFGRLSELRQRCVLVDRCLRSMEMYARNPWARPGVGLLYSAGGDLKRTLPIGFRVSCMELGLEKDELVIGGLDGVVHVIDVNSGHKRRSLYGHQAEITGICVDRSVGELLTCAEDGRVIVWFGETLTRQFYPFGKLENNLVTCMEVLDEPGLIACGSEKGEIRLIDRWKGETDCDLHGHTDVIMSLEATSGGKVLVSCSDDRTVRIWDVGSKQATGRALIGHEGEVNCVSISADSRFVSSGSNDGTVRLWDMRRGVEVCAPLFAYKGWVRSVVFSGDAKLLYSAIDNEVLIWDVSSPQNGVTLKHKLKHNMGYVNSMCASSDNTELFVAGHAKQEIFVWRANPRQTANDEDASVRAERSFMKGIKAVGISPDGLTMATSDGDSIEVRRTRDVSDAMKVDDVLAICHIRDNVDLDDLEVVRRVAVTSDKELVAFSGGSIFSEQELTVYIMDICSGIVMLRLTSLGDWLKSLRADSAGGEFGRAHISKLNFNATCSSIIAVARVMQEHNKIWLSKSLTWNIPTGTLLFDSDCLPTADGSEPQSSSDAISLRRTLPSLEIWCHNYYGLSNEVRLLGASNPITVGTLEFNPNDAVYDGNSGRLWICEWQRGMNFLDVIFDAVRTERDALPPPSLPLLPRKERLHGTTNQKAPRYTVFISHAGPEKLAFAIPLKRALEKLGIDTFVDVLSIRPGESAARVMIDAMNSAPIGVFLISPQFVARPWTMKEVMCFLERDRVAREKGLPGPIIIPVFLHLTVSQCRDAGLLQIRDENGDSVFEREGFFEREKYGLASSEDVSMNMKRLTWLTRYTGIENVMGATSNLLAGDPEREGRKREHLIGMITAAIQEAMYRRRVDGRN